MEGRVSSLETAFTFVKGELDELKKDVKELRSQVSEVNTTVKAWGLVIVVGYALVQLAIHFLAKS